jgi:hypothetical protein
MTLTLLEIVSLALHQSARPYTGGASAKRSLLMHLAAYFMFALSP